MTDGRNSPAQQAASAVRALEEQLAAARQERDFAREELDGCRQDLIAMEGYIDALVRALWPHDDFDALRSIDPPELAGVMVARIQRLLDVEVAASRARHQAVALEGTVTRALASIHGSTELADDGGHTC